jgi:methylthioribose-1-phosphate isomerase
METSKALDFETVVMDDAGDALIIIDQTLLPNEFKYLKLQTQEEIWEAIYELRVRGAPELSGCRVWCLPGNKTQRIVRHNLV